MLELVERKGAGEEIAFQQPDRDEGPTPDLMAALEASLAEAGNAAQRPGKSRAKTTSGGQAKAGKGRAKPAKGRAKAGKAS